MPIILTIWEDHSLRIAQANSLRDSHLQKWTGGVDQVRVLALLCNP
jgi:hypothetical protein